MSKICFVNYSNRIISNNKLCLFSFLTTAPYEFEIFKDIND